MRRETVCRVAAEEDRPRPPAVVHGLLVVPAENVQDLDEQLWFPHGRPYPVLDFVAAVLTAFLGGEGERPFRGVVRGDAERSLRTLGYGPGECERPAITEPAEVGTEV